MSPQYDPNRSWAENSIDYLKSDPMLWSRMLVAPVKNPVEDRFGLVIATRLGLILFEDKVLGLHLGECMDAVNRMRAEDTKTAEEIVNMGWMVD